MQDDAAYEALTALSRAKSGDAQAFTSLVRLHERRVYSLALRMLTDRHEAEDLAQEVFMQLHRKLAVIESAAHLTFWLRKVTTHLAIDRLRKEQRHEALVLDNEPDIAGDSHEVDPLLQRQLRELVSQLPPAPRAVVVLRFQEDLDPAEIAETLTMPVNTVKSHLKRSLATLRKSILRTPVVDAEAKGQPL